MPYISLKGSEVNFYTNLKIIQFNEVTFCLQLKVINPTILLQDKACRMNYHCLLFI